MHKSDELKVIVLDSGIDIEEIDMQYTGHFTLVRQ